MDRNGDGQLDISDIKGVYDASKHPDVMLGRRSEEEVLYDFLDTFQEDYNLNHENPADHIVTLEEWIEYQNKISMNIEHDEYYEIMIKNAYHL